ncbi:MAG: hypothetical protein Q7S95_00695 [bacterium]|nr:hypothetical protein [bacterium]
MAKTHERTYRVTRHNRLNVKDEEVVLSGMNKAQAVEMVRQFKEFAVDRDVNKYEVLPD